MSDFDNLSPEQLRNALTALVKAAEASLGVDPKPDMPSLAAAVAEAKEVLAAFDTEAQ